LLKSKELKNKIYNLLHENKTVIKFIYGLIILNVIALILESYEGLKLKYQYVFQIIEIFSVIVFTIEYVLRLWVSNLNKDLKFSRLKFITSPLGLIDLLAILPFYLPMMFPIDLRIMRILRLLRLLKIFKFGRFSKSITTINQVLKETKTHLIITLFIAFILLLISSTLMYYVENEAQPDKFSSIGHSLWWAVATLTTVGYGDIYPVTALGKLLSAIIALIGIGFIALPTGIISSAFIEKIQEEKEQKNDKKCECPNCGTKFKISKNR
jgi:voltage-gated potassium channel